MEIINFRNVEDGGCLKYSFTICIKEWGELEIDASYFEKENGTFWLNYAPQKYQGKDGLTKYWGQVRFSPAVLKKLNTAIRDKIKKGEVQKKQSEETVQQAIPF